MQALAALKPRLVVTFSILQDIVGNVAGEEFEVESVVPLGTDPHVYEIKPGDIKKIIKPGDKNAAAAVFLIGLGFEGSLENIIEHSKFSGLVVKVTGSSSEKENKVKVRLLTKGKKPVADPHVWGSVKNVMVMVRNIRDALVRIDPKKAKIYQENAEKYMAKLQQMHKKIIRTLSKIPEEKRKVVTTHDAFYYYGEEYNVKFLAPIGISTESEPSARDISKIIDLVKKNGIRAIFFEKIANMKLIKQIAEETGVKINPEQDVLYADSLSKQNGPAATYIKMMWHNTLLIAKKLAPGTGF